MKKKYKLSNGKEIPSLGFGTFRLKEEVEDILKKALKVGYRLLILPLVIKMKNMLVKL